MTEDGTKPAGTSAQKVEALLSTPDLASALESEPFRRFLDQIPIALVVSEMKDPERIVYANPEFTKVSGQPANDVVGHAWTILPGKGVGAGPTRRLGVAISDASDFIGTFRIERHSGGPAVVDTYSHVIENDDGTPAYRLAALVDVGGHDIAQRAAFAQKIREKDTLLLEIQHRVKNNLQLITALIRIEARNARGSTDPSPFHRLAGRIEAIQLVYRLLSDHGQSDQIDLGVYLSEIASSVMRAHAVEGIRLDLKVDAYPVSVNVAMPTGLVVNELLTNALKHAFIGRDRGTITLHSLSECCGCRIVVADDGIGLPDRTIWPRHGKLGALIVESLRQNAKADLAVDSRPGQGTRVTIRFARSDAAPEATD